MFYIGNHVSSSNGFEAMGKKTTELGGNTFAFFKVDMYPDLFTGAKPVYMSLLLNLIERLVQNGSIICGDSADANPLVIGAKSSRWEKRNALSVNDTEAIILEGPYKGWYDKATRQMLYCEWSVWGNQLASVCRYLHSDYSVSEELKELVKNDFKTDEEIRFAKQQWATWISIAVAIILGILGIIF